MNSFFRNVFTIVAALALVLLMNFEGALAEENANKQTLSNGVPHAIEQPMPTSDKTPEQLDSDVEDMLRSAPQPAISATTIDENNTIKKCQKKGMSHVATVDCEYAARKKIEEKLTQTYAQIRADTKEWYSPEPDSVAYEGLDKLLDENEAAFKAFVKSQCDFEAGLYGTGNGAADVAEMCPIRLISRHLQYLDETRRPIRN